MLITVPPSCSRFGREKEYKISTGRLFYKGSSHVSLGRQFVTPDDCSLCSCAHALIAQVFRIGTIEYQEWMAY